MGQIHLLDTNTINQIAAGEVIERPAAVVKELVENAIDAGATAITVEIRDGGITFLRVSDNGSGIDAAQAPLAFERHATSKITTINDLDTVYSLGFRGEALASIAAVGRVTMVTKTAAQEVALCLKIEGGNTLSSTPCAGPTGTSVTVENLFYNVPARKKFLKKPATESGYITDVVHKLALAHPDISFQYKNNQNILLHTSGNHDLKTAVFHVYGKEVSQKMLPLSAQMNDWKVEGLIGRPELSRGNRGYENLFINGRFVKNEVVSQAVEDAYRTRLMIGKFPVFVLNLSLKADMVDVNVHPAKLTVRFREDDLIYDFIYHAVLEVLEKEVLIPSGNWESKPSDRTKTFLGTKGLQQKMAQVEETAKERRAREKWEEEEAHAIIRQDVLASNKETGVSYPVRQDQPLPMEELQKLYQAEMASDQVRGGKNVVKEGEMGYLPDVDYGQEMMPAGGTSKEETAQEKQSLPADGSPMKRYFTNYRIIGQVFQTYWIVEQEDSLFLIDQHAAHERVLFEQFYQKFQTGDVVRQRLLEPVVLSLTDREKEVLYQQKEQLESFGFEVEQMDENTFLLREVPYLFDEPANADFFLEMLDKLGQAGPTDPYQERLLRIATMACKAAVKAHDRLSVAEGRALVEQLMTLENPFTCPHGRPTIIELTKYELEKKFKRIV